MTAMPLSSDLVLVTTRPKDKFMRPINIARASIEDWAESLNVSLFDEQIASSVGASISIAPKLINERQQQSRYVQLEGDHAFLVAAGCVNPLLSRS